MARLRTVLIGLAKMCAIEYGAPPAAKAIVEAGVPVDNLFVAAGLDRMELMEDLLSRGADINARYSGYS